MARESLASKRERAAAIEERMFEHYGPGKASLDYRTPFELTVAVVLSAQCTDAAVNKVTPRLFAAFPTPAAMATASSDEVAEIIHSLGFFRSKAKNLVALAQMVTADFGGDVPADVDELQKLPGVGRKTANLILGDMYHTPGVVVADTHCIRITGRLGITDGSKDPVKVEQQLRKAIPPAESGPFCHRMVLFGLDVCTARSPQCEDCPLKADCAQGKKLK